MENNNDDMMKKPDGFTNKLLRFLKLDENEDGNGESTYFENNSYEDEYEDIYTRHQKKSAPKLAASVHNVHNVSNVVDFQASVKMQVFIIQPNDFSDSQIIANHIRSKNLVVINLKPLEQDIAQKILDFLSGACFVLDGSIKEVGNNTFMIAPSNVNVTSDIQDELNLRELFGN